MLSEAKHLGLERKRDSSLRCAEFILSEVEGFRMTLRSFSYTLRYI